MAASFRASLQYSLLIGGSFLEHPGGEAGRVPYTVEIVDPNHEITQGVNTYQVATEQYYMECDPNNHVLAETTFNGDDLAWVDGHRMPVAWTKTWGEGRVFYCAIGHFLEDLQHPDNTRLMTQGFRWAARSN
jgi:type 1 glutamine amidotransferase